MTTTPLTDTVARPIDGSVFDAVLFDMDGTLVSSTPAVRRSWQRWGEEYGLPVDFRDGGGHGKPARDIVADFVAPDQVDSAYARIQEIEIGEVDDVEMLPGAAEALAAIGENRKAIVTSCSRPLAEARIRASGLIAPVTVITVDDVENGKPDPEPFVAGATALGFPPARCLVVEDAFAGLEAGRAAGAATLGIAGTHTAAELTADVVVAGLDRVRFTSTSGGILVTILP